jgi:hypothetical protein
VAGSVGKHQFDSIGDMKDLSIGLPNHGESVKRLEQDTIA